MTSRSHTAENILRQPPFPTLHTSEAQQLAAASSAPIVHLLWPQDTVDGGLSAEQEEHIFLDAEEDPHVLQFSPAMKTEIDIKPPRKNGGTRQQRGVTSKTSTSTLETFFNQADSQTFSAHREIEVCLETQSSQEAIIQSVLQKTRAQLRRITFQVAVAVLRKRGVPLTADTQLLLDQALAQDDISAVEAVPEEMTCVQDVIFHSLREIVLYIPEVGWVANSLYYRNGLTSLADAINLVACHNFIVPRVSDPFGEAAALRIEIFQRLKSWLGAANLGKKIHEALEDEWIKLKIRDTIHQQLKLYVREVDHLLSHILNPTWWQHRSAHSPESGELHPRFIFQPTIVGNYCFPASDSPLLFKVLREEQVSEVRLQVATRLGLIELIPADASSQKSSINVTLFSSCSEVEEASPRHGWKMAAFVQWLNAVLFAEELRNSKTISDVQRQNGNNADNNTYIVPRNVLSSSQALGKLIELFYHSRCCVHDLTTNRVVEIRLGDLVSPELQTATPLEQLEFLINELAFFAQARVMKKQAFAESEGSPPKKNKKKTGDS